MITEQTRLNELFGDLIHATKREFPCSGGWLRATEELGVYVIYDPDHNAAHVGSTPKAKRGIHQRLTDHLAGRSSFTKKWLQGEPTKLRPSLGMRGYMFQYVVVEDRRLRALLEAYAIGHLCPHYIGHGLMAGED